MHKKNFKILLIAMIACLGTCGNVKAEEYSSTFQRLTTDGVVRVNAVEEPVIVEQEQWGVEPAEILLSNILENIPIDGGYWSWDCSSTTECEVSIYMDKKVDDYYTSEKVEAHNIKIEYLAKRSEEIATRIKNIMNQMKTFYDPYNSGIENYVLEDLNLINYYYAISGKNGMGVSKVMNFIPDVIALIQNQPITIDLVRGFGMGDEMETVIISSADAGTATFYYDGVAYGYMDTTGTNIYNIIYIPSETENTKEAYVAAIKQRLGNNVEVTCAGVIPEESDTLYVSTMGIDLSATDGNYYKIKIGDTVYPFVVMKKDELNTLKYQQKEGTTGIQITTTDVSVPYDTVVTVEEVKENTDAHNAIKDVIKTVNFKAFDISLYSELKGANITTLENGHFQVTIPLGKEYVGKDIVAYYIRENRSLEEHDIVMDEEGNARFETNHFSTYIITERLSRAIVNAENPNTYDGIQSYILLGIISMIVLSGAIYMNKKQRME